MFNDQTFKNHLNYFLKYFWPKTWSGVWFFILVLPKEAIIKPAKNPFRPQNFILIIPFHLDLVDLMIILGD